MKLQKQLNRRVAGKEYRKWVLVLPPKIVKELGWKDGQELKIQIDGRSLRMRPFVRG